MKLGVLFFGRKRPGFDQAWGAEMEERVREALAARADGAYAHPERVVDNETLRAGLCACEREGADVLVALQTTMSDGRLAPVLGQLWPDPIVLWATPEKHASLKVSSCSLVGTHAFAAILRQMGKRFELVYGMPGTPQTRDDLQAAARVAYTVRRLRRAQVGLVGYHAPGFVDMHADPVSLDRAFGVQLRHFGLRELTDAMEALPQERVEEDVAATLDMGFGLDGVTREDVAMSSRYYLALSAILEGECLDALALRCWPELTNTLGHWPYVAVVRLLSEGKAVVAEGDVDGALSCLVGNLMGFRTGYLSDWLEHDRNSITLWHAGDASLRLCEPFGRAKGPSIGRHFNDGHPGVVNAVLRARLGVTIFRLWRCDGEYRLMAFEGETVPAWRELEGVYGLVRLEHRDAQEWFEDLVQAGMPHHVAVFAGRRAGQLRRLGRQLGVRWIGP